MRTAKRPAKRPAKGPAKGPVRKPELLGRVKPYARVELRTSVVGYDVVAYRKTDSNGRWQDGITLSIGCQTHPLGWWRSKAGRRFVRLALGPMPPINVDAPAEAPGWWESVRAPDQGRRLRERANRRRAKQLAEVEKAYDQTLDWIEHQLTTRTTRPHHLHQRRP